MNKTQKHRALSQIESALRLTGDETPAGSYLNMAKALIEEDLANELLEESRESYRMSVEPAFPDLPKPKPTMGQLIVDAFKKVGHYQSRFLANGGSLPLPPCPLHGPGGCWEPDEDRGPTHHTHAANALTFGGVDRQQMIQHLTQFHGWPIEKARLTTTDEIRLQHRTEHKDRGWVE